MLYIWLVSRLSCAQRENKAMLKLSTIPQVFFQLPATRLTPLGSQLEPDIWRHEQILRFRSSGTLLVATFGCIWLGHQQIQGPRAWIICEILGSYLVRYKTQRNHGELIKCGTISQGKSPWCLHCYPEMKG
nr:uncharacterized protein LOC100939469 isoform X2 [Pongo abelii]